MERNYPPVLCRFVAVRCAGIRRVLIRQRVWILIALLAKTPVAAAQTNFGPVNLSSASTSTVTAKFIQAGTVARIDVLTQGGPNLDFTTTSGGTCSTGSAYAQGASCTVTVNFKPRFAGNRTGAVVLSDASGNVLANTYLQGSGQGSQIGYVPATAGRGMSIPSTCSVAGVAVDAAGSVYVACASRTAPSTNAVYREQPTGGLSIETKIAGAFGNVAFEPQGVAVDGAGNVFVSDDLGNRIFEIIPTKGGYVQTELPITGLQQPMGLALDGAGNLYVASSYDRRIVKVDLNSGAYAQTTVSSELAASIALAVDGSGNIYVAETCGQGLCMLAPSGNGYVLKSIGQTTATPTAVAVDSVGNVYIEDNNSIYKDSFIGGAWVQSLIYLPVLPIYNSIGMAVDSAGNLWMGNPGNWAQPGYLEEVDQLSSTLQLSFDSVLGVQSAPQSMGIVNLGNQPLQIGKVTFPPDFKPASPVANPSFPPNTQPVGECSAVSVPAGDVCTLSMSFLALSQAGEFDESIVLTSTSMAGSPVSIPVRGSASQPSLKLHIKSSADPSVLGQPVTITMSLEGMTLVPLNGSFTLTSWATDPLAAHTATFTPDATGTATFTSASLPAGATTFELAYTGDTHYALNVGGTDSYTVVQNVISGPGLSDFGNPDMGAINLGFASGVSAIQVTFIADQTLGGVAVLTQGAPNLDFQDAGGGTCAIGHAYSSGSHCTVNVVFKPRLSGPRYGGIVLTDTQGNVIGTGYLQGTGIGPLPLFLPGVMSVISANFFYPNGLSVDGAGDIYFADGGEVHELVASNNGYTLSKLNTGLAGAQDVAVDGGGNVFVASLSGAYKLTPANGSYTVTPIGYGMQSPEGVAVDGVGNVYIANYGGINSGILKETPSNGSYIQSAVDVSWSAPPGSVAVDGKGNLYVTESQGIGGTVSKETFANGGYTRSVIGSGWFNPVSVAVDIAGNVYVVDNLSAGTPFLAKATPQSDGSYTVAKLSTGLTQPHAVGLDGSGNLYISAWDATPAIHVLTVANPPALAFAATAKGATSTDSPQQVTVANAGNGPLNFSAIAFPADFPQHSGATGDCSISKPLAAGATCTFSIDFTPAQSGTVGTSIPLSETLAVTANPASSGFSVPVFGTENIVANPSFTVTGTSVTVARGAITGNTAAIIIAPSGGFTGNVTLTAALATSPAGAQYLPTFSFGSGSTVTVSGAGSVSAMLIVSTTAPSAAKIIRPGSFYAGATGVLACCLLLAGTLRRRPILAMLALGLFMSAGVVACGGGGGNSGGGGGGGGGQIAGTTQGNYTITVTGTSGSATASGTVNLTVQ